MFDRFSFIEAYYAFCCDYHCGQTCELYQKLSRISRYFKPSPLFKGEDSLDEYGKEVYAGLEQKYKIRR